MHKRKYPATDPGGSLKVSGRYNRGLDAFPEDQVWPALYLSTLAEVCLGEIVRHLTSPAHLAQLNGYELSELRLELQAVLDCRDPAVLGLSAADLLHDTNYDAPQQLAAAAMERATEALVVPSATRLGANIVVLTAQLRTESVLEFVSSRSPNLYIDRPSG